MNCVISTSSSQSQDTGTNTIQNELYFDFCWFEVDIFTHFEI